MKTIKISPSTEPVPASTNAGPGHNPTKPQPKPNKALPANKGLVIAVASGQLNLVFSRLCGFFLLYQKATKATAMAPNSTDRKSTRLNSSHSQISYALLF